MNQLSRGEPTLCKYSTPIMALKEVAADYFRSINSMANRLCEDLDEIKTNYEDFWENFSEKEKSEIINESIIKPEISVRYSECVSKTQYEPARKSDNNYTFKDEHSAPFKFRTVSQENLFFTSKSKISPKVNKINKTAVKDKKKEEEIMTELLHQELKAIPKTGLDLLDNW